jgi:hypothetical protein
LDNGNENRAALRLRTLQLLDFLRQGFVAGQQLAQFDESAAMRMLICTARSLLSTAESIATPCSLKARGAYFG